LKFLLKYVILKAETFGKSPQLAFELLDANVAVGNLAHTSIIIFAWHFVKSAF